MHTIVTDTENAFFASGSATFHFVYSALPDPWLRSLPRPTSHRPSPAPTLPFGAGAGAGAIFQRLSTAIGRGRGGRRADGGRDRRPRSVLSAAWWLVRGRGAGVL